PVARNDMLILGRLGKIKAREGQQVSRDRHRPSHERWAKQQQLRHEPAGPQQQSPEPASRPVSADRSSGALEHPTKYRCQEADWCNPTYHDRLVVAIASPVGAIWPVDCLCPPSILLWGLS